MNHLTTILAFVVVIPFAVGMRYYKRIPAAYLSIVYLCGIWTVAEVYSFLLRINGQMNAHVSYVLTALEILLFASFYSQFIDDRFLSRILQRIGLAGFALVAIDYFVFNTAFNTFSLSVEYILLTFIGTVFLLQRRPKDAGYSINLILLFYLLSSFPYFFAWEWLRISNRELLQLFSYIHSVVHAICYLAITYILWKSSLSYLVR